MNAAPKSDEDASALLEAEREAETIEIIAWAALSPLGQWRIGNALDAIRAALNLKRQRLGLRPPLSDDPWLGVRDGQ